MDAEDTRVDDARALGACCRAVGAAPWAQRNRTIGPNTATLRLLTFFGGAA